ncbi:mannitol dehydrogenase [Rhodobacterales bacterium HTCC2150]|nr:mannitol dehydrogenase [Rhodobacterales bacterium HTCC2150] [Rhodobacteraceae bacterium HTCC2150]
MPQILHFGVGNFFRAHQAAYTALAGGDWRISGVSMRSDAMRRAMAADNFAYTLVVEGGPQSEFQVIDVIDDILLAPTQPDEILTKLADADVQIVTATVTEKGYHLAANGELELGDPDIQHDMNGTPKTLIGFLAIGLSQRKTPMTILSCDNRMDNGRVLERAVKKFASAAGLNINWNLFMFPNSMVDRITPATTDELRNRVAAMGYPATAPVPTEAFSEWVIEDNFATPRPDWAAAGARFVTDVAPHEMRKLRMLNGAHSMLAYQGVLAGHEFVHQAIADPTLLATTQGLMAEAALTLPVELQDMSAQYGRDLIARFANPSLAHSLRQIAMDGSQKIPYRFLQSRTALREMNMPSPCLDAALQAWMDFCRAETKAGRQINDPLGRAIADASTRDDFAHILGVDPAKL